MERRPAWQLLPAAAAVVCAPAQATVYLTVEQAQAAIFPGAKMVAAPLTLDDAQRRAIEQRSGVGVRRPKVDAWQAQDGGWLIVDRVLGKHDYITYAVGIAEGRVVGIEIMEYRETYGYQVRQADWRKQFAGKTVSDPLKLDVDIRNISGATLSCRHVTDGVKRLLATYEVALKQ